MENNNKHSMTKYTVIYIILAAVKIAVGFFGSSFVIIADGFYSLSGSALSLRNKDEKKGVLKTVLTVLACLPALYSCYYSSIMLLTQLSYASFRPQFWTVIPLTAVFLFMLFLLLDLRGYDAENPDPDPMQTVKIKETLRFDIMMTLLAAVGMLGTFVFDFYIEYAASLCISLMTLRNLTAALIPERRTKQTVTEE